MNKHKFLFIHSLTHSLPPPSLTHILIHSLTLLHSLTHSLTHPSSWKLSRNNEKYSRYNENVSRVNENISRNIEKVTRNNENISSNNEKLAEAVPIEIYSSEPSLLTYAISTKIINPFMPNGFSHFYRLDELIFKFRVVIWYFFNFIQIVIQHSVSKYWRPYVWPWSALFVYFP